MLLFRIDRDIMAQMPESTPEMNERNLQAWQAWLGQLAQDGRLVGTEELQMQGKVMSQGGHTVTDGPFIELKELLGGYTTVLASSIEEACDLAKGCPMFFMPGATVEVRPIVSRSY